MDIEKLKAGGIDWDNALTRFSGNAKLYERLLGSFLKDDSFPRAAAALESNDMEAFFDGVHTLKSVSGNLELTRVFEESNRILKLLRAGQPAEAKALFPVLAAAYQAATDTICAAAEE